MIVPDNPYLGTYYIGKEEEKAVIDVIKSKSLFRYQGPNLLYKSEELEKKISEFLNVKYVLMCNSGASALKLCCVANKIGNGDEVIMSPFTFVASANSVLCSGALPVFCDVDKSMNIDPSKIEDKITSKTKAIMAIHMQGYPCDMIEINKIAQKHNLIVIEDVAQAFGCVLDDKMLGSYGDCSAFSLQAGKTITCGEGGFFATNDEELYERAKMYHDNGGVREGCNYPIWIDNSSFYGENYKITEIQSAIALEQLKKIDIIVNNQKLKYIKIIKNVESGKYDWRYELKDCKPVYSSLSIIFESSSQCDKFINYMVEHNIYFRKYCDNLIYDFDTFKKQRGWHDSNYPYNINSYIHKRCDYTENIFRRVAWLNLSAELNDEHINYIIDILNSYED